MKHLLKIIIILPLAISIAGDLNLDFIEVINGRKQQDFTIGVALGAGSAKGLAHIGVLKALEEYGLRIDYIAGSSMGSAVGAGYAAGLSPDSLKSVVRLSNALDFVRLLDPIPSRAGLIDGEKIRQFLLLHIGKHQIQDLPIPYAATTVDINTGKLHIINSGDLSWAVRASISVPIIFTPVVYDSLILIDGGFAEPVPVQVVRDMGADFIIAVNVLAPLSGPSILDSLPELNSDNFELELTGLKRIIRKDKHTAVSLNRLEIAHSTYILLAAMIAESRLVITAPDLVIAINTGLTDLGFLEWEAAIEKGYERTIEVVEELKATSYPISE